MNARTRNRLLWSMAIVVLTYLVATVAVYYATGAFGATWLAVTLVLDAVLLLGAVVMMLTDRPARRALRLKLRRAPLPAQDSPAVSLTPTVPAPTATVAVSVVDKDVDPAA